MISRKQFGYVALFTIVETVILALWIALLGQPTLGIAVLFLGLFIEHYLAIQAGNFPRSGQVHVQPLALVINGKPVSRRTIALLLGAINAIAAFLYALLPEIYPGNMLIPPLVALIDGLVNVVMVYLMMGTAPAIPPVTQALYSTAT